MTTFCRASLVAATFVILSICGCASHPHRQTADPKSELSLRLDSALHRDRTGSAHYAARVVDLKTGQELYSVDADSPYMPASNGKIAVTAATLDFFGPDATFKTWLAMDGDNLWLIGSGDPCIGDKVVAKKYGETTMTVLDEWAGALRAKGITHISGKLIYYDGAFDNEWTHKSWGRDYITDWYAAPISGLNFNNNCVDISVKPTSDGNLVTYSVNPPTQGVKVINKCYTGHGREPDVTREHNANVFTVSGATTKPFTCKGEAVTNPGAFFADALRTHLASKGITIDGKTERADKPLGDSLEPPKDKIIAVHETKLTDAMARILKASQNNVAEGFCKMLGRAYRQKQGKDEPGSWRAGSDAVKAFLTRNNIDVSELRIVDGSGLSRGNRVTARLISDTLATMWKHPYHQEFFDAMAGAGADGTIEKRMPDLKGRVKAKTGYIGGVRSLSGYVQNEAGDWLVFSFIFNGIHGTVKPVELLQDNACRVLAAWPRRIELPTSQPTTAPSDRAKSPTSMAAR